MAFDVNQLSSLATDSLVDSSDLVFSYRSPTAFDPSETQSAKSGELDPELMDHVDSVVALSKQTYAPEDDILNFKNSVPSLGSVQPTLVGSGFGSGLDWNNIENSHTAASISLSTENSDQATDFMNGGFMSQLMPSKFAQPIPQATVLPAVQTSNVTIDVVNVGSFCAEDGMFVFASSSRSLASASLLEGEGPEEPFLPEPEFPDLESSQHLGSMDTFAPLDQNSSSTMTLHGAFTPASLNNPDYNALGMNWVHFVEHVWISPTQWSFTERLVAVFNFSNTETETGNNDDTEPSTTGLDETSSWSSTLSASRHGFITLLITASQGVSTLSAAGVQWSVSVAFSDTINIQASASGNASFTPTPVTGGEQSDYPSDFTAGDNWSSTYGGTSFSSGSLSITSTPSVATDGIVDRSIAANLSYNLGDNETGTDNWSASSQSGSLVLLDHPSAGGNPLICLGDIIYTPRDPNASPDDDDFDPIGPVSGNGHGSMSSGSGTGTMTGSLGGSMNLQGTMRNGQWTSLLGGAMSALDGAKATSGGAGDIFVYNNVTVTVLPSGTITSKVLVKATWDAEGSGTGTADAVGISTFSASPEGTANVDDNSTGSINGNGIGHGNDFMSIDASTDKDLHWTIDNQAGYVYRGYNLVPYSGSGFDVGNSVLTYRSRNNGTSLGSLSSMVAGIQPATTNLSSTLNGNGYETLVITSNAQFDSKIFAEFETGNQLIDYNIGGNDSREEYGTKYSINGTLTGVLESDESVSWTIMATASVDLKAKYAFEGESVDHTSFFSEMVGGFDTENHYHAIKEADFEAGMSHAVTISGGGNFGTATRTATSSVLVDEVFSQSGNPLVNLSGHDMYGDPWEKNALELELEAIFATVTPPDDGYEGEGEGPDASGEGEGGERGWAGWGLDWTQNVLDYAGFVFPPADILNAGVSAGRGDLLGAGVNLAAAIPIFGDGAKGVKLAADALQLAAKKTEKAAAEAAADGLSSITKKITRFGKLSLKDQIGEYGNLMKTYQKHLEKYGQKAGETMGETNRMERELEAMRKILEGRGRVFFPDGRLLP